MSTFRVIYRKWDNGDVIAWLPDVPANPGRMMSYEHVGQHGEGIYPAATLPAMPEEYADLHQELTKIYAPDELVIVESRWE